MELIYYNTSYDSVQIKESHATIILLSIIFISSAFKPKSIKIPQNTITIIEDNQIPIYPVKPSNNTEFEALVDTTIKQTDNIRKDDSRNWMSRYKKGIRFEFYPPN